MNRFKDSGFPHQAPTYLYILKTLKKKNTSSHGVRESDTISPGSPSQISVLNPAQNHNHDINDNVITLMIRYGGNIFLLIGDAGKKVEYGFCQNRRIRNRCTEDRPPREVENNRYAVYQSCLIE